jgi:hypothetical protein
MEVRRPEREGDHTAPYKNTCNYVSTPPYGFMTFRGATLFTFTFAIIFITEHYKCKRLLDVPLGSMDRDSSVGIATGYGLDVPRSNSGGSEILRTFPDRPWGPPSLLYNGYRVFPGGKKRPGRDADPSPPSSAVGHKRVELYLYSPYGP